MVAMAAVAAASELYLPIILCVFASGGVVITSHAAAPPPSESPVSESQLPPDRRSDEELKTSSRVFPVFAIFSVIASHSTFAYKGKALKR